MKNCLKINYRQFCILLNYKYIIIINIIFKNIINFYFLFRVVFRMQLNGCYVINW